MHETNTAANSSPGWLIGETVCAFAQFREHLGHILKADSQWIAYDATRMSESGVGFRIIGVFPDMDSAKLCQLSWPPLVFRSKAAAAVM